MPNAKCEMCGKTAYPLESINALDKTFHKSCFKCTVCSMTLNVKNFKGYQGKIYCLTHTPKEKNTAVVDSIALKHALNAPKKGEGSRGIHKADPKVAPAHSGDFTVNATGDQSTENNPESSGISYDAHHGDQSTESNPDPSGISYDSHPADQSTEGTETYQQEEAPPTETYED